MKKYICALLAGMILIVAGCTPQNTSTEAPTGAPIGTPTEAPTEAPSEDIYLFDINASTEASSVYQEDLSFYGVGMSQIGYGASEYADDGEGMIVNLGDSAHWCQGLQFLKNKAGDAFARQIKENIFVSG